MGICIRKNCKEPKRGTQFCNEHSCDLKGCNNGPQNGSDFCGPHANEVRELMAEERAEWDSNMICSVEDCNNTPVDVICQYHMDEAYDMMEDPHPGMEVLQQEAEIANREVNIETFTVAGTGSRSLQNATTAVKKAVWDYLIEQLTGLKEKYGDRLRVMSGMAEGFDKALALAALSLDIKVVAVIPNKGYGNYYWGKNSLTGENRWEEFTSILDRCEEVIYVMEDVYEARGLYLTRNGAKVHSNFIRNEYMVEHADAFYVYDSKSSGTAHCYDKIRRAGLPHKMVPMA